MRLSLPVSASFALTLLLGCQQGSPLAPEQPAGLAPELDVPLATLQTGETFAGIVTIQIAPDGTHAEVVGANPRLTQSQPPQNLSYDLDLDKFLSPTNFRVSKISNIQYSSVNLTLQFTHPFRAPIFTAQPTAGNRADLGFTGRLVILADENHNELEVPSEGTFSWDNKFVLDPDGFAEVGDLLRTEGLSNNLFPYVLLVDEARDNRVDVSNGGEMTGNYDAPGGGWQQANAGDPANQWTGYDYVHQGQSVEQTIRLNWTDVRAAGFQFRVALLAKYTDPRGVADYTFRLPKDPVDITKFAYRLPHAALDVSQCDWCGLIDVMAPPRTTRVRLQLRDWDSGANEVAGTDLAGESDVSKVVNGAGALPIVELLQPSMLPAPEAMTRVSGTGAPGDELEYVLDVANTNGWTGDDWGLFRATDPEVADPEFGTYHKGVDPDTLVADPARALKPRTFMPVRVRALPGPSWYRSFQGATPQYGVAVPTPEGHFLVAQGIGYTGPGDYSPESCIQQTPVGGKSTFVVTELDENGKYLNHVAWANPNAYIALGTATRDGAGNTYVGFAVANDNESDGAISYDVDPGPGTQTRNLPSTSIVILKLDSSGALLWDHSASGGYWTGTDGWGSSSVYGIVEAPNGDIYMTGTFYGELDLDPGAGEYKVGEGGYGGFYLTSFDPAGNWQWGWGQGGRRGASLRIPFFRPNGDVVTYGSYSSDLDCDPGPGELELLAGWLHGGFRAQFTGEGAIIKAINWTTPTDQIRGNAQVNQVAQTTSGVEWVSGRWDGEVDFDPTAGTDIQIVTEDWSNPYLMRFDSDGNRLWWATMPIADEGKDDYGARGLATDPEGGLIMQSLIYQTTMDVDPGPGETLVADSTGSGELFWSRLDANGDLDWVRHYPQKAGGGAIYRLADGRLLFNLGLLYSGTGQQFGPAIFAKNSGGGASFAVLQADGTW